MSGIDWAKIRKLWEQDSRDGAAWLVKEYNLPMTRQAVQNKIRSQKWTKTVSPVSVSHRRETEKQRNEKQKCPKTVARQETEGVETVLAAPPEFDQKGGLSEKERVLVSEYLKDFNASRAFRAAGFAKGHIARTFQRPAVQSAIRTAVEKRCFALGVDADAMVKLLVDIVACDVGELMPIRHIPCPYCWSEDGAPQMTMERYEKEKAQHNRLRLKMLGGPDGEDIGEFPPATAFTFVDPNVAPNADCTVCHGEGQVYTPPPDTSTLSPGARQLYGGYVLTKDGPQVIVRAKEKATEMLAKALGLFAEKEEEKTVEAVSTEQLLRIYNEKMRLARERQAIVDRERGLDDGVVDAVVIEKDGD